MFKFYYNYYKRFLKSRKALSKGIVEELGYDQIGLINPSIGTANMGDIIIYDAVYNHLRIMFKDAFLTNYPSHLHTSYDAKLGMAKNDVVFVGGTNLLSSYMDNYYQWKLDPNDKFFLKNKVVLMGVGWWQYQNKPNAYTKKLLTSILSKDYIHSVRDSYTRDMLKSIGINNVVNTTCPTLWNLTSNHCSKIQLKRTTEVVTTLTYYKSNERLDRQLLEILTDNYEKVYLWVQGIQDVNYLKKIYPEFKKIILVPPTMEAFNSILENPNMEYVGTRLHAGIRAIQKGKRTLILAVDNRALEISKDTNLNVIPIEEVEKIQGFIKGEYNTSLNLPIEEIASWKNQFVRE